MRTRGAGSPPQDNLPEAVALQWKVQNRRDMIRRVMKLSDEKRMNAFARVKSMFSRDAKGAKMIIEIIEAMGVPPSEYSEAVCFHEEFTMGEGGHYTQTWMGFCTRFEAILARVRRNARPQTMSSDEYHRAVRSGKIREER